VDHEPVSGIGSRTIRVDDAERVGTGARKESATALYNILRRVLDALEALPGVRSAAVTKYLPYSGASIERIQADIFIKGRAEEETTSLASITGADVSPDYFATMRIPLVKGRLFDSTRHERIGAGGHCQRASRAAVLAQSGLRRATTSPGRMAIPTRSSTRSGERSITGTERTIAVPWVKTVERTMVESLWQRRIWGVLFTALAALALGWRRLASMASSATPSRSARARWGSVRRLVPHQATYAGKSYAKAWDSARLARSSGWRARSCSAARRPACC
jgi:hypothetical protein